MAQVLMGKGAGASDKELAAAIMAGEMRTAWQKEDRPNRPDERPKVWKPQHRLERDLSYYENYDLIDWSK